MASKHPVRRTILWLALLLLAAGGGWWLRDRSLSGPVSSAAPHTAGVMRGRLEQTVKARGIVKPAPNAMVRIGFPMPKEGSRRIRTMKVVEGDRIQAGDVLAELDHGDLLASLQQLKADAMVVETRLEASRILEPVEVHVAKTMRDQAKAQADLAQRNFKRAEKLKTTTAVSQQEYDTALNDMQVTVAKLANAAAGLEQVKARFRTDIATLEAQVKQAAAAIRTVAVQIAWSTLHAPIGGVVFAVHQRPGELTSNVPHAPVLTLLDP